ncbi:hypothetical protein MA16_Dca009796 [Dendrobium catenatum]|uniref:DUF674 domain-containing protein n=1 Tax=Dendrobium catenatum TaxID=906689 RepID=A0A2I0XIB1_9ASPA|nr:hypothetical protein MA16_Dca009796 [Dendrobium catenatum]
MADLKSKITLKLLIDVRSHKVLFGEAGKDFVDFLFSLLTLPLGCVIKLVSPPTMIGSIGKLYQSVENLNEIYLVANRAKASLLQPEVPTSYVTNHLLLSGSASSFSSENAGEGVGGFVKGVVTYMITDDLEVTPMSAISSIALINRFIMKKDVQLEEKVVAVGMEEGLALLRASLDSPTALTDVFCSPKKKEKPPSSSIVDGDDD